jgi:Zn-dependent peptidase ImmA (M78 family)
MNEDLIVKRRSAAEIHALALDWRRALQIETEWSPNLVETFENRLPKIILGFELVAQDDALLNGAEGFARYPRIFIRKSIRQRALDWDGRSRMTLAHELGHLVMHPDAPLPRMVESNKPAPIEDMRRSAEWQTRKFGAFFLMPEHIVREFATFEELAQHCNVSREAAEIRFNEVGHIKRQLSSEITNWIEEMKRNHLPPKKKF